MSELFTDTLKGLQLEQLPDEAVSEAVFGEIMRGEVQPSQIAALLMGLSVLGENADVVAGAARAMRQAATRIHPKTTGLIDTCGTGGSGISTLNISTASAFVVAGAGVPVAKHGNRAISSRSGSADVLESLGVNLTLTPEQVADCIDATGIGFLFAQQLHPAMKHAGPVRRELGIRTVFNLLGPLTNPAGASFQVLGVYAKDRMELIASALQRLGTTRALVVHGRDGMDEITTTDITDAIWIEQGQPLQHFEIDPAAFGMPYATSEALQGGGAEQNAAIIRHVLAGQHGAARDIVLLNAAASLWVAGKADGIPDALRLAAESIDSGKASACLQALVKFTNQ